MKLLLWLKLFLCYRISSCCNSVCKSVVILWRQRFLNFKLRRKIQTILIDMPFLNFTLRIIIRHFIMFTHWGMLGWRTFSSWTITIVIFWWLILGLLFKFAFILRILWLWLRRSKLLRLVRFFLR